MQQIIIYGTILILLGILAVVHHYKRLNLRNMVIIIAAIAYSMVFECFLGEYLGLYHYIKIEGSILYIILSGIFIYPILNVLYIIFLPDGRKKVLIYTGVWIIAMLLFEYFSVAMEVVVFTGWNPLPWSIVTYIVTYIWLFYFNRRLEQSMNS